MGGMGEKGLKRGVKGRGDKLRGRVRVVKVKGDRFKDKGGGFKGEGEKGGVK